MKTTERLGLALPEGSDYVNIETLNENFRRLDALTPDDIKAAATMTYTATVETTPWTESGDLYYQDIAVNGILETDNPIPGVLYGTDNDANALFDECFGKVFRITTSANSIRAWATEEISTAFPIQLKVVR